ncbi:hypothetical protein DEO72_LG2g3439 [Vigna unguiculata]|uniref:Uncharacterized protein n=1 Tax=Vigna unguiculata TaxID=3917 RepID=A0A4D6L3N3_VIGUN|nr:hypothetical protein DEO72_LG2g3439 [Vigna unguiculata]
MCYKCYDESILPHHKTFITILKTSTHNPHKAKKVIPHCTVSLSPSPRLRGLAQARRARSGEPPLRLGEGSMVHSGNITGSRLSEIPLAWARRSLAQEFKQVAWATFRATALGELPVSSRLGEIDSLGRDLQVSPLFSTVTATYINQPTSKCSDPHSEGRTAPRAVSSGSEQGLSSSLKEGDLRANPSRAFRESKGKD